MQVQCEMLPNATCGDNFCSPQHELIRFAVLGFILAVFKKKFNNPGQVHCLTPHSKETFVNIFSLL